LNVIMKLKESKLKNKLAQEVVSCFESAIVEGLIETLNETQDKRLKDLVERRLMFVYYAALEHNKMKGE